ncbi:MAG: right-handed parallel beta-helix repeat-containing protein [Planctomycetota bacterium]
MRVLTTTLLAIAACAASSVAQGDWVGGQRFFVAPGGDDANTGLSRAQAWRTLTFAASQVRTLSLQSPVTLNVMPGTYGADETYPIRFPARGVAVEADGPGVVITGDDIDATIWIDSTGQGPNTVLQGLTLIDGNSGVLIDPINLTPPIVIPLPADAVTIRDCTFDDNLAGIIVVVQPGRRATHVIERNEILGSFSTGIDIVCAGESSTWVRANRLIFNEKGMTIFATSPPRACQPRIESNFFVENPCHLISTGGSPYVVNNTMAFASSVFGSPCGIQHTAFGAESITIVNNVLWNPGVPELAITGAFSIAFNDIEDPLDPNVGINNNVSIPPGFVSPALPFDVHLTTASPLIGLGQRGAVLPPTALSTGTLTHRVDVGMDVDGDSRMSDFNDDGQAQVEIGGDEVNTARLAVTAGADAFGNMGTSGGPINLTVTITGAPLAGVFLYQWFTDGTTPIAQSLFADPFGCLTMNPAQWALMASGTLSAGGATSFTFPLPTPLSQTETEFYLQAVTTQTGLDITNRQRLEFNP